MEGPISFWGYKEQESNLILHEHDDDDDDDDDGEFKALTEFKHWCQFYGILYDIEINVHYV